MYQSVPTAVALGPHNAYYVGELTGVPFPQGGVNVYRGGVDPPESVLRARALAERQQ